MGHLRGKATLKKGYGGPPGIREKFGFFFALFCCVFCTNKLFFVIGLFSFLFCKCFFFFDTKKFFFLKSFFFFCICRFLVLSSAFVKKTLSYVLIVAV